MVVDILERGLRRYAPSRGIGGQPVLPDLVDSLDLALGLFGETPFAGLRFRTPFAPFANLSPLTRTGSDPFGGVGSGGVAEIMLQYGA